MAIYRSNLTAPDLRRHFKLLDPPMQHCGYDAPSDPDFLPNCTFFTPDEAAILFSIAKSVPPGIWVDIGARLGWTAAHIIAGGQRAILVDPELRFANFIRRMEQNTAHCWDGVEAIYALPWHVAQARIQWERGSQRYGGFVIDGCHDSPEPLNDAMGAVSMAKPDCIILFHDFLGPAIRDAVRWLMDQGWHCRIYWTPNGVACCWRGYEGFRPPDHVSDPRMDFAPHKAAMVDFESYWSKCE